MCKMIINNELHLRLTPQESLTLFTLGDELANEPDEAHIAVHLSGKTTGDVSTHKRRSELLIGELAGAANRTLHALSENAQTYEEYDVLVRSRLFDDGKSAVRHLEKAIAFLNSVKLLKDYGEIIIADSMEFQEFRRMTKEEYLGILDDALHGRAAPSEGWVYTAIG